MGGGEGRGDREEGGGGGEENPMSEQTLPFIIIAHAILDSYLKVVEVFQRLERHRITRSQS